eukprot:2760712-Rhodomonas_salina.1
MVAVSGSSRRLEHSDDVVLLGTCRCHETFIRCPGGDAHKRNTCYALPRPSEQALQRVRVIHELQKVRGDTVLVAQVHSRQRERGHVQRRDGVAGVLLLAHETVGP